MFHERRTIRGGSEFASGTGAEGATDQPVDYVALLEATGQTDNERVREQTGRALVRRVMRMMDPAAGGNEPSRTGRRDRPTAPARRTPRPSSSRSIRHCRSAGPGGVVDDGSGLFSYGDRYPSRQAASLGGGTTEIARNIIGERILGFPREHAPDRGVPFNQVKRGRS